jgi:hypothetical protein
VRASSPSGVVARFGKAVGRGSALIALEKLAPFGATAARAAAALLIAGGAALIVFG